jgi:hypothetical protein
VIAEEPSVGALDSDDLEPLEEQAASNVAVATDSSARAMRLHPRVRLAVAWFPLACITRLLMTWLLSGGPIARPLLVATAPV